MNDRMGITKAVTSVASDTDGAVGVSDAKWYIAVMKRPRSEKAAANNLAKQGYKVYVATQKLHRQYRNGRCKTVDHVVIPSVVFINCTEEERLQAAYSSYISHYMVNSANDTRGVAIIPDYQIERLKFMLGQSDVPVEFIPPVYKTGDKVRVIRGSLLGLEGEIINMSSTKREIIIALQNLGCAKLTVDVTNLELIN